MEYNIHLSLSLHFLICKMGKTEFTSNSVGRFKQDNVCKVLSTVSTIT